MTVLQNPSSSATATLSCLARIGPKLQPIVKWTVASPPPTKRQLTALSRQENFMVSEKGPNIKKKQKCKNCEGKGLLKKGDKVVKCQRCKGTGVR